MSQPVSTYRLQCNAGFDLDAVTRLVPYLAELGVDWIYLSPVFAATRGSTHGYDVTDPTRVNPELGGREALDRCSAAAHDAGLGVLLDIVPNHQAASEENPRWREMLATRDTHYFDAWFDERGELHARRFFDVGELVGVRVERPDVFRETHALVFELLSAGVIDGLRVDHVDGLVDPEQYLRRLHDATGGAYVVVEKILARDETLRESWPVAGTTGYEAGVALTELLIDPDGRAQLEAALLAENGGRAFDAVEHDSKVLALDELFAPEWSRLQSLLDDAEVLAPALHELTVALDVYRTYDATDEDRVRIDRASVKLAAEAAEPLRSRLLASPRTELVTRWQQLSGAVMAKGHEDTACYRYPALLAQNEVGGDPGADARDAVTRFGALASRHRGMIGTSTHDTKRSEDVRARLCVLSERAGEFERGLTRWRELVDPGPTVTAAEQRFVAQTLLGAWPLSPDELHEFGGRIEQYLRKALREAKQQTNWIHPDERHEEAVIECARRTIVGGGRLLAGAFGALVEEVAFFGAISSLAMLTWKLGMPGAPDIYQGCELWDLSLVDPDNRRPVDFARRAQLLQAAPRLDDWRSGAVKLHVTAAGLRLRRAHRELFAHGAYIPLETPDTVLAFARRLGSEWAVAVAPRLPTRITECGRWPVGDVWGDATIELPGDAPPAWRAGLRLADVLADLPAALVVAPQ
ncbi:MAG TPA: malto-oligosyltrehalose synthase [Acidimicrobiia bacterium]|nr:malto-oligosyltrehalose synthase [Acidimicrobiia bacterium]